MRSLRIPGVNLGLCFSDPANFSGRHEEELGLGVDEARDQPRTGYAIDLWTFPGYPLHRSSGFRMRDRTSKVAITAIKAQADITAHPSRCCADASRTAWSNKRSSASTTLATRPLASPAVDVGGARRCSASSPRTALSSAAIATYRHVPRAANAPVSTAAIARPLTRFSSRHLRRAPRCARARA